MHLLTLTILTLLLTFSGSSYGQKVERIAQLDPEIKLEEILDTPDDEDGEDIEEEVNTTEEEEEEDQEVVEEDVIDDEEPAELIELPEEIVEIEPIQEDEDTNGPKKVTIDTIVYVDYQFYDSSDAFKIKYHINMGGRANLSTAIIRGRAEVATEVTGYLAKSALGQCILDVNIAKVPYEISYRQDRDEADINVKFRKEIFETWESTCTFIGGITKPFKTQGPPERWIEPALEKAIPPITSIIAPLKPGESTTTKFDIPEYTVIEEGLGNAVIKGTGVVTIQPIAKPGKK